MHITVSTAHSRLAGALRVAALGTGIAALVTGALFWRARVRADELLLSVGAQMMHYARADGPVAAQSVSVNGQIFHLQVSTTADAPDVALDHFAARCAQRDGMGGLHNTADHAGLVDGVLRTPAGEEGAVACLDMGRPKQDAGELLMRLREFARTGDVSRVGELRFAHAKSFGAGHTLLVTSWVDGALDLGRMFPEFGDAPGSELPGVPRPTGARRLLSAHSPSGDARLNSYASDASNPNALADTYRVQLAAAGFESTDLARQSVAGSVGFAAQRGGEGLVVTIRESAPGQLETSVMSLR